ncbi:sulfhydryl oxidase 1-like [Drosophila ficusphila]|uniref:sulfhydryl oxidase 1-like n=1 Tax=Drosophila ficusphila TaxID=30025 RepID=UPI0007E71594|nr:sulfhydryl oxidase 1-like [Drosophila ficusphila]
MIRPLPTLLLLCGLLLLLLPPCPRVSAQANASEVSLYDDTDNVEMLDIESLRPALYQNTHCKLVQFLNSFCGDCQRFAPVFKAMSRDLYKWRRLLRIYGVDCAQERNSALCRDYNIRQTPTLRFFGPKVTNKTIVYGEQINSQNPKRITAYMAEYIPRNDFGPGQPNFRRLKSGETAKSLFQSYQDAQSPVEFIVVVLEQRSRPGIQILIGRNTLLDLLPYKEVAVRYSVDPNIFANFGLPPSNEKLAIFGRAGSAQYLHPSTNTSEAYVQVVGEFLEKQNIKPVPPLPAPKEKNDGSFLDIQKQAILAEVLKPPAKVYRADLEQAIDKLLHVELQKWVSYEKENYRALTNIITLISDFNPLNKDGKVLLTTLRKELSTKQTIKGSDLKTLVATSKMGLRIFKARRYIGCIGSRPLLRSFTCSLWTLFHYLTVEAAKPPQLEPPGSVLNAVHGFAKYFFGCTDCSQHFQQMAIRRNLTSVKSYDEQILWLWAAHNEVNQRIAGDPITEDPKFKKIQFPSSENCPPCRDSKGEWVNEEVLKYLKSLYDKKNLSFYGLPTPNGYD